MMKAFDLRTKTPDELAGLLADLRKEQFNLRFQKASGQLENTARIRGVRRDIARVVTIMGEAHPGRVVPAKAPAKAAAKVAPAPAAKTAPELKAAEAAKPAKAKTKAPAKASPKKAAGKKGK